VSSTICTGTPPVLRLDGSTPCSGSWEHRLTLVGVWISLGIFTFGPALLFTAHVQQAQSFMRPAAYYVPLFRGLQTVGKFGVAMGLHAGGVLGSPWVPACVTLAVCAGLLALNAWIQPALGPGARLNTARTAGLGIASWVAVVALGLRIARAASLGPSVPAELGALAAGALPLGALVWWSSRRARLFDHSALVLLAAGAHEGALLLTAERGDALLLAAAGMGNARFAAAIQQALRAGDAGALAHALRVVCAVLRCGGSAGLRDLRTCGWLPALLAAVGRRDAAAAGCGAVAVLAEVAAAGGFSVLAALRALHGVDVVADALRASAVAACDADRALLALLDGGAEGALVYVTAAAPWGGGLAARLQESLVAAEVEAAANAAAGGSRPASASMRWFFDTLLAAGARSSASIRAAAPGERPPAAPRLAPGWRTVLLPPPGPASAEGGRWSAAAVHVLLLDAAGDAAAAVAAVRAFHRLAGWGAAGGGARAAEPPGLVLACVAAADAGDAASANDAHARWAATACELSCELPGVNAHVVEEPLPAEYAAGHAARPAEGTARGDKLKPLRGGGDAPLAAAVIRAHLQRGREQAHRLALLD
jgi:hypothetical protein